MTVSVRDVATAAGVSIGTVSNVLNRPDRVADATIARVHAAIDELGFVRNDAARQLRAGRSRTIGLVVLEAANPFFADVARGAEQRARQDGLIVLLANSDDDTGRERANLDLFEEQRVAGVVVSPAGDDTDRIERLAARGTNVVLLERPAGELAIPSVSVDNVAGGRIAVEHLAAVGRRHVTFVGGPITIRQVSDRLAGARAAAERLGVRLDVVETPDLTVEAGRRAGIDLASASDRADAIFAANDLLAIGALQGLRSRSLTVPEDVAIIGYDDIEFAASVEVPLSSVRQPSRQLGWTAVDLLLTTDQPAPSPAAARVFDPELVVRASTGGA